LLIQHLAQRATVDEREYEVRASIRGLTRIDGRDDGRVIQVLQGPGLDAQNEDVSPFGSELDDNAVAVLEVFREPHGALTVQPLVQAVSARFE
jgi:hypothetical protein